MDELMKPESNKGLNFNYRFLFDKENGVSVQVEFPEKKTSNGKVQAIGQSILGYLPEKVQFDLSPDKTFYYMRIPITTVENGVEKHGVLESRVKVPMDFTSMVLVYDDGVICELYMDD